MASVPEDVWRHIAQFLSQDDLHGMIEVNSSLFHLAMDAKYRSVSFQNFNDAAIKKLQRLRDPIIALRVRHLSFNLLHQEGYASTSGSDRGANAVMSDDTFEYAMEITIEAMSAFSNVTHFSISWHLDDYYGEEFIPFLAAAWKILGPRLLKVVLSAPLGSYPVLLSTSSTLTALQELEIEVQGCKGPQGHINVLATAMAPFINKVASNLESLSLSHLSRIDHSALFNSLGDFNKLQQIAVRMGFNMCGLSDPRGLTRILRNHAMSLRHVKWTSDWDVDSEGSDKFVEWMEANQSDKFILSNLLTLEIVAPSSHVGFDLVVRYIRRSADTLTSLLLYGPFLSHEQVTTILSIFTHRPAEHNLQMLLLRVKILSPKLVLELASTLPLLHKLVLNVVRVTGNLQSDLEEQHGWKEAANTREFIYELKHSDIQFWKLYDIGITAYTYFGTGAGVRFMRLFADCVPSIRKFFGKDKEGPFFKMAHKRRRSEELRAQH